MRQFLELPHFLLVFAHRIVLPKQNGNTPKTRQSNQCVDNAAEQISLTAEQPGDQVKLKDAHQPPV